MQDPVQSPITRRWLSLCGDAYYQRAMGRQLVAFPDLADCQEDEHGRQGKCHCHPEHPDRTGRP